MAWKHLACCATTALALTAAAPEPTKLRFAWPETVKARVSYTSDRTRVLQNGATTTSNSVATYDLNVSRRGEQIVVARGLSQTPPADGKPLPGFELDYSH